MLPDPNSLRWASYCTPSAGLQAAACVLLLALAACGDPETTDDGNNSQGGADAAPDTVSDSGTIPDDSNVPDAGQTESDTRPTPDGSDPPDAQDSGPPDPDVPDTGTDVSPPDGGDLPDADVAPDSVDPPDADVAPDSVDPPDADVAPDSGPEVDVPVVEDGPRVFLTVEQFEELRADGAQLYDARSALEYADGHVPGAFNASWNTFVQPGRNGIVFDTVADLQPIARSLGLRADSPVVVYGSWGSSAATTARLFWTFEYIGHDEVYLLNADFADWKELGIPVETTVRTPVASTFEVTVRSDIRATLDEIVDIVTSGDDNVVLIDTRTDEEWLGDNLRGNPRGGRIPTAVHLHWLELFNAESGTLLPREQLIARLTEAGVTPDSIVVPYCQSGVRSAFLYALLRELDYRTPQNFDGSFWEWSRDEDLPVAVDQGIFVDLGQFEELRANGATILDARSALNYTDGHVPGAVNITFNAFVDPARNGIVKDSVEELQTIARSVGIQNDVPVVIYGDWGSSAARPARLFWTIEYLGHREVYLLNAGFADWRTLGIAVETTINTPTPSTFVVEVQPQLRATLEEVVEIVTSGDPNVVILDTRTLEEWLGDNLRGNPRGGHIPNAVHLHWLDLFDSATGTLLPRAQLQAILTAAGISRTTVVVPYCQSGVRSGFLYALLRDLGYLAPRNYDGSFWEWSRAEDLPVIVEADAEPPTPAP